MLGGVNSKSLVYSSFNLDKEITKVNPIKALISGKFTKDYIGKTIYLSNSASSCQEWLIADIDHDGTNGTVDLFPKYVLCSTERLQGGTSLYYLQIKPMLNILNRTIYNGFTSEIKSAMLDIPTPYYAYYVSGGSNPVVQYINHKIKIPSCPELGIQAWSTENSSLAVYYINNNIYPLFGDTMVKVVGVTSGWGGITTNVNVLDADGNNANVLTRDMPISTGNSMYSDRLLAVGNKSVSTTSKGYYANLVGFVRFGKAADARFNQVDPVELLTSGTITEKDIGRIITLSNSATKCQEWVIADVDVDGDGSVDLISRYTLMDDIIGAINPDTTTNYSTSNIREQLNGTILNGFSAKVKQALATQHVSIAGGPGYVDDKVVAPSPANLCITNVYNDNIDFRYIRLFGPGVSANNSDSPYNTAAAFTDINGDGKEYWTNFVYYNSYPLAYKISTGGRATYCNSKLCNLSIVGMIRFKKA